MESKQRRPFNSFTLTKKRKEKDCLLLPLTNQNWHLSRSMTNEPLIQVSREMQISFLTLKECQKTCHDAIRERINRIASFTSSPGLDLQLRHFILHLRVLKFNCFKLTLLEKGFICSQDGWLMNRLHVSRTYWTLN